MRNLPALFIIVVACTVLICGCTIPSIQKQQAPPISPSVTIATAQIPSAPVADVRIIASSFDPAILTVKTGTTVMWINEDKMNRRVEHLPVLPSDKLLFRSESLSPGESFSYTFNEPGRYKYGDPQHGGGSGTYLVIVS